MDVIRNFALLVVYVDVEKLVVEDDAFLDTVLWFRSYRSL